MTKTATRRCGNPKCGKPLTGRGNRLYCNTRCSAAASYARQAADPDKTALPDLCYGCRHPTDIQADPIAKPGVLKRHPFSGKRPPSSGWCVDPECPCVKCRPENAGKAATPEPKPEAPKDKPRKRDIVGKCPLPRLRNKSINLANLHKRAVAEGRESCSCGGN